MLQIQCSAERKFKFANAIVLWVCCYKARRNSDVWCCLHLESSITKAVLGFEMGVQARNKTPMSSGNHVFKFNSKLLLLIRLNIWIHCPLFRFIQHSHSYIPFQSYSYWFKYLAATSSISHISIHCPLVRFIQLLLKAPQHLIFLGCLLFQLICQVLTYFFRNDSCNWKIASNIATCCKPIHQPAFVFMMIQFYE